MDRGEKWFHETMEEIKKDREARNRKTRRIEIILKVVIILAWVGIVLLNFFFN